MNEQAIIDLLRARFDMGQPLRSGLESALQAHPGCEAYCRRLERLESQMGSLPWIAPDPHFTAAVKSRLRAEPMPAAPRPGMMLAAVACCVLISGVAGYLAKDYLPYSELERQIMAFHWSDLTRESGAFLEPTPLSSLQGVPYAAEAGDWLDLEALLLRTREALSSLLGHFDPAPLYLWSGLAAACVGMLGFNGALLRSVNGKNTWVQSRH
ncbi:MAG: hypothetical protein HYV27_21410 [Candidatus Hydrogenedentes bacterium]|nr:hypothetical protein [Candidatus Hydrogenedentota bacterium]